PLGVSGEVLQMLRLGMHDVEMGGPGRENGVLRVGRQSAAKLVFGLVLCPLRRAAGCEERPRRYDPRFVQSHPNATIQECCHTAGPPTAIMRAVRRLNATNAAFRSSEIGEVDE